MANRVWVGGTGNWSDTAHWSTTTGPTGNPPQSVPTSADAVSFDANSGGGGTGVCTVDGSYSVASLTFGAWPGTLDWSANNGDFTCIGNFLRNGSVSTDTLKMGSGTFTVGGWAFFGTEGTFLPSTSKVVLALSTTADIIGAATSGYSHPDITIGPATNKYGVSVSTALYGGLNLVAPVIIKIPSGAILGPSTLNVTTPKGKTIHIRGTGSAVGLVQAPSGTIEFNWSTFRWLTFSGGATFVARNSFDLGGNTGIAISPPRSGLILGG